MSTKPATNLVLCVISVFRR